MKKILLSALLGGFVLNNGYCFDEEHKITEEYLHESFIYLGNVRNSLHNSCDSASIGIKNRDEKTWLFNFKRKMISDINDKICYNLKNFLKELLTSVIPSGEHEGRTVVSLLREYELDSDTLETICDCSIGLWVDVGSFITFEFDWGGGIEVYPYLDMKNKFRASITFSNLEGPLYVDIDIE